MAKVYHVPEGCLFESADDSFAHYPNDAVTFMVSQHDYELLKAKIERLVESAEKASSKLIIGSKEFNTERDSMAMHRAAQIALIELQDALNEWEGEVS